MNNYIYLLILHMKGIDWASGYGTEHTQGATTSLQVAKDWVKEHKENGFERRMFKKIKRFK